MSENNVMVHCVPFLITTRSSDAFFVISTINAVYFSVFWKHGSCSCMEWRTRRQTSSCRLFLLTCVMQTNQTQRVTCNMTVVPAPGTFSAFIRFWYIFFFPLHKLYTLSVGVYVAVCILQSVCCSLYFAVCMLQSVHFILIYALHWTFPFDTIT